LYHVSHHVVQRRRIWLLFQLVALVLLVVGVVLQSQVNQRRVSDGAHGVW
jgi:hypothetical protein